MDGLHFKIEDQVGLQPVHTLRNAIRLAKKVEVQLEKQKTRNQSTSRLFIPGQQQEQRSKINKENRNSQNIWPAKDSLSSSNPYAVPRGDKCFPC